MLAVCRPPLPRVCCYRAASAAAVAALAARFAATVRGYRASVLRQTQAAAAVADLPRAQAACRYLAPPSVAALCAMPIAARAPRPTPLPAPPADKCS